MNPFSEHECPVDLAEARGELALAKDNMEHWRAVMNRELAGTLFEKAAEEFGFWQRAHAVFERRVLAVMPTAGNA